MCLLTWYPRLSANPHWWGGAVRVQHVTLKLFANETHPTSKARSRGRGVRHNQAMRVGIAHHFGWAIAVTASESHEVIDRRRIELIEPGLPAAPIHHVGGPHRLHRAGEPLDDPALVRLVADVRASVVRATSTALDEISSVLPAPITSLSVRAWPADFPQDVAVQRRVPYESRADSVMYCQLLAEQANERDWAVHLYNAKSIEGQAARILGPRTDEVLHGPRATLGAPWSKDHRTALAAAISAG